MKSQPTNFFVVMTNQTKSGKLRCIARTDPTHGYEELYAYTSRTWAEKFAAKHPGSAVYSIQGLDLKATAEITDIRAPLYCIEWHWIVKNEAERVFNPR